MQNLFSFIFLLNGKINSLLFYYHHGSLSSHFPGRTRLPVYLCWAKSEVVHKFLFACYHAIKQAIDKVFSQNSMRGMVLGMIEESIY